MRILDEKSVRKAALRNQIDRHAIKASKPAAVDAPRKDLQRVESLLAELSESMKGLAQQTGANSEAALAVVHHALAEVSAMLRRLAERPKQWTFKVNRDADGLIHSIEARR